jgi:exodeoxyribonuclease VII large subunit
MERSSYRARNRPPMSVAEDAVGVEIESVSSLTRRIKAALEAAITPCWVRGELSNFRAQASGHLYFSLKDADSQIACVIFRGDAARNPAAASLQDGAQVIVFGEISVYEPRGNYQLIVRAVVDDGVGRLQQQFERLKQRLAAEGLFEPARKKPLPPFARTVGFITSPTGAAVQDFIRILKRRGWRGRLVVLPAKVQGDGAAAEMFAALELAHQLAESTDGPHFDLLVIGRGGGSLEDLWAFNEEPLVRAVAASRIPVISAVGHEIDFTLCDFAADVRAETPSAAAELISSGYLDMIERVRRAGESLDGAIDDAIGDAGNAIKLLRGRLAAVSPAARLERAYLQLDDVASRLAAAARRVLQDRRQRLTELGTRLAHVSPAPAAARARERLSAVAARLEREIAVALERRRQRLAASGERLQALGPASVLRRGFVILRGADGRPVVSRANVRSGDRVRGQFHDGDAPFVAE